MSYEHLSLEERRYIEVELKAGTSMNQIEKALGRFLLNSKVANGQRVVNQVRHWSEIRVLAFKVDCVPLPSRYLLGQ